MKKSTQESQSAQRAQALATLAPFAPFAFNCNRRQRSWWRVFPSRASSRIFQAPPQNLWVKQSGNGVVDLWIFKACRAKEWLSFPGLGLCDEAWPGAKADTRARSTSPAQAMIRNRSHRRIPFPPPNHSFAPAMPQKIQSQTLQPRLNSPTDSGEEPNFHRALLRQIRVARWSCSW